MLFSDISLSIPPLPPPRQQQLLHNNLVKGWALSSQSKMCKMDMDGILKNKQTE